MVGGHVGRSGRDPAAWWTPWAGERTATWRTSPSGDHLVESAEVQEAAP